MTATNYHMNVTSATFTPDVGDPIPLTGVISVTYSKDETDAGRKAYVRAGSVETAFTALAGYRSKLQRSRFFF